MRSRLLNWLPQLASRQWFTGLETMVAKFSQV
jgi:hypothetical protein